jgi:hypothetical protein
MADEIDELERRGAAIRKIVGMHHWECREHRDLVRALFQAAYALVAHPGG